MYISLTITFNQQDVMLKQIVNGRVLTPQGWLVGGSVVIDGNKIKLLSVS